MDKAVDESKEKLRVVTEEIRELKRQANHMALAYAVEIGRRLTDAKLLLPHGEWGQWLRAEVEFSQSTANNFMRLFEEYGEKQMTIFGAVVNSQTIANLPYSKALQLLAVPREEREEFAAAVDAGNVSVKELSDAIKEKNRANEEAKALKKREEKLRKRIDQLIAEKDEAVAEAQKAAELRNRAQSLATSLEAERQRSARASEELELARKNPQIPAEKLEEIKRAAKEEAERQAAQEAKAGSEEFEKMAKEAQDALAAAQAKVKSTEEKIAELEKKLKVSAPEVTEFKTVFEELQGCAKKLLAKLAAIRASDPQTAEKLSGAIKAFIKTLDNQ